MYSTPLGPASLTPLFTKLPGASFEHHTCMMACKVSHKDVANKFVPDKFVEPIGSHQLQNTAIKKPAL